MRIRTADSADDVGVGLGLTSLQRRREMASDSAHPMAVLMGKLRSGGRSTQSLAILSPVVQLSFVFHLALAILDPHHHHHHNMADHPLNVVTVIAPSQTAFQELLDRENDASLVAPDPALAGLLDRIEFRFCADLAQLLVLLCDLTRLPIEAGGVQEQAGPRRRSGRMGLIITDLSSYVTQSLPASSTLSHLTRLLGFISSTQSQLASIHQLPHPPPVCIIDRIDPALQWPLSAPAHPDHLRHVQDIFAYFFQNLWAIQKLPLDPGQPHALTCMLTSHLGSCFLASSPYIVPPHTEPSATNTSAPKTERYRLFSPGSSSSKEPLHQIIYQVSEVHNHHSSYRAGSLRQTVVIEDT